MKKLSNMSHPEFLQKFGMAHVTQECSLSLRGAMRSAGDIDDCCAPSAVRGDFCPMGCSSECRSGSVCLEPCTNGSVTKGRWDGSGDTGDGMGVTGCIDGRFEADVEVLGWPLVGGAGYILFIPRATSRR